MVIILYVGTGLALPKHGGVLVTGPTVAEALGALYAAEHAATIQAHAVSSGYPSVVVCFVGLVAPDGQLCKL